MKQLLLILALFAGICVGVRANETEWMASANDSTQTDILTNVFMDTDTDMSFVPFWNKPAFSVPFWEKPTFLFFFSVLLSCVLLLLIVIVVRWFQYKNKQAEYALMAKALDAGKPLPDTLFTGGNEKEPKRNTLTKGIRNIFLGIGLGVFLWVLTDAASLAAIGFLIFCRGCGQVVIAYVAESRKDSRPVSPNNRESKENPKEETAAGQPGEK